MLPKAVVRQLKQRKQVTIVGCSLSVVVGRHTFVPCPPKGGPDQPTCRRQIALCMTEGAAATKVVDLSRLSGAGRKFRLGHYLF